MNCWKCGTRIETLERIGFRQQCPKCERPLHVCRNCAHYDPAYNNQCREPMAERVVDKERANFCEYFAPAVGSGGLAATQSTPERAARERLEALFKKKP
ncbi:MAG TPA: hypothetical protein VFB33_06745 [Candidatus Binataceae bacterium]|nr:hypothetical protein [Candidatus Binataceae bacterium]